MKRDQCFSSELIAKSLGTNAVVVRRVLGMLQQAGFVTSYAGSQGGSMLAVEPESITLKDIYEAVEGESVFHMHEPHPKCPVARSVVEQVEGLLEGAEDKMKADLARTKLSAISGPALIQFQQWKQ